MRLKKKNSKLKIENSRLKMDKSRLKMELHQYQMRERKVLGSILLKVVVIGICIAVEGGKYWYKEIVQLDDS